MNLIIKDIKETKEYQRLLELNQIIKDKYQKEDDLYDDIDMGFDDEKNLDMLEGDGDFGLTDDMKKLGIKEDKKEDDKKDDNLKKEKNKQNKNKKNKKKKEECYDEDEWEEIED